MEAALMLWGVLFSSIGLGYFIYGKRQANAVVRYTGVALMIYPYFIADTTPLVLVGLGLMFLPRFMRT